MIKLPSTTSTQIRFSLQSLNESNSESVLRELRQSLESAEISEDFLQDVSNALQLSLSEKIVISLALTDSENTEARLCGKNYCMTQIEALCANPVPLKSAEQIQNIVLFLQQSEDLSKHVDSFMQMLSLVQLSDENQFVLTPFLPDELREANFFSNMGLLDESGENDFDSILAEMEKEMSMGDIMKELGYECTADISSCKEILSLFLPLTEPTVAKILGMISCNHTGLEDNQNTFTAFSQALGCSTLSDLPKLSSWNVDVLIETVKHLAPGINWVRVMENLDHEGFFFPNEEAFSFFMSVYRHACQDPFPLHAICGSVWRNTEGQLSFLRYALLAPPEVFTFAHSGRNLAYVDTVHGHKLQLGPANHAWLCLDLIDVLCQLAERGHVHFVRSLLQYPLAQCPDVLFLGMAHVSTTYNLLQTEVSCMVSPMMIKSAVASGMVMYLWHVNPSLVLRGFIDAHKSEPDCLSRILDICQELQILSPVLEKLPFHFGIRLAVLASRKEIVDLEMWLANNLNTYQDIFFQECLKFVKDVQSGDAQDFSAKPFQQSGASLNPHMETSLIILKVLKAHSGIVMSASLVEDMEKVHITVMDSNQKLTNGGTSDSSASEGYGDDVEMEANSYFQQMFSGQLSTDAMIQMLAQFKESPLKRERLTFECMLANLFEEYTFFPKYPEKQLKIAAIIFGSVIKHQLVTRLTLGIALRAVLDSLRKSADKKMFAFGTIALEQFVDRLIEWPQYCNHILQISHLRVTHSELVSFIERALARISSGHSESDGGNTTTVLQPLSSAQATLGNGELNGSSILQPMQQISSPLQPQQRSEHSIDDRHNVSAASSNDAKTLLFSAGQSSVHPPTVDTPNVQKSQSAGSAPATVSSSLAFIRSSRGATSTRFGSAMNIETLVAAAERSDTAVEAPASEVQDKISFIMNNISVSNLEAKVKEFIDILKEQYYPWFAQYMVMKRASIEPNFHDLYLKFLDKVNSKALNKEIVQVSYENCKVLLGSELIKSSSEERSLLKNLGSWLGKLTIGRNQVLRAREIDPKSLIIEAYEKGLMIAVIPFTSKVLEPCQSSLAYQPPNPWTMGILGLLVEIYQMPNLKMNLKFDIELTAEVKSGILASLSKAELPPEVAIPPNSSSITHLLSKFAAPHHLPSSTLMEDEKLGARGLSDQLPSAQGLFQATTSSAPPFSVGQLPAPSQNIVNHVVINPKLNALGLHTHFQRVVPIAMDRAVKEIVSGIVQRSVSIATQTTKELVLKDYATDSDDTRVYNAAHLMVASLAGSLAHVTCKEPLRGSISSHLRNTFQGLNIPSEFLEQAVQLVTNDNLDLGCAVVEAAATEKALQTIDGEIAQQLAIRRKHRESVGASFFDPNLHTQGSMGLLPEVLRPKPGHLSVSQQRVYEDFVRLPWQNQPSQNSGPSTLSGDVGVTGAYGTAVQLNPDYSSSSLDGTAVAVESNSVLLQGGTSVKIEPDDVAIQQSYENDSSSVSFPPPASTTVLHPVDTSHAVKDQGTSLLPLSSPGATDHLGSSISEPLLSTRDAIDKYQLVAQKLEALVTNDAKEAEVQGVVAEVPEIILRCVSRDEAALALAQKVFKGLYENTSNSFHVGAHLAILAAIRDVCKLVVKELTSWVIYSDEERKLNKDITIGLIRSELLNLAEYNAHMAKLIDGGRNKAAMEFSMSLLETLVTDESSVLSELHNLVDALAKVLKLFISINVAFQNNLSVTDDNPNWQIAGKPGCPEPLTKLVDIIKNPVANADTLSSIAVGKEDMSKQTRDKKASGLSTSLKEDSHSTDSDSDPAGFREQASMLFAEWYQICELPGTNDAACTNFVLQLHHSGLLNGDDMTDRFFRVITELSVSHCLSSESINSSLMQPPQQSQSLSFLAIDIYGKLVFSILKILTAFANTFHTLQPLKVPAFSNKFLAKSYFDSLLDLKVQFLYKGTVRVLLVLLHDFPEFLCDYHLTFCDVIPPSCIQMRNIILSAFPRNMRLPDPSTPNLKIDLLPEIREPPRILSEVDAALKVNQMKAEVDDYLKVNRFAFQLIYPCHGVKYLEPSEAIQHLQPRAANTQATSPNGAPGAEFSLTASLDIYMTLIMELETEGRYLFLNAIANQLRYPNNHTHYFSFILLYLFAKSNQEIIQEQITRVLLERLIVNKPHPWGLLITFIELIKNPRYNFWNRSFIGCAPEIEKLFESVARSCGGLKPMDDSMVSSWISENAH
ncbi:hypothetical protein ACFE04_026211 [Oxalis oulophora]